MNILVIHEKDYDDNEEIVIGVADSVENAEKAMSKYYGNYKEISHKYIGEDGIEYVKVLELSLEGFQPWKVRVTLEWFTLNDF